MNKLRKPGNYWIKTKTYLPWEIAWIDTDGTWYLFSGAIQGNYTDSGPHTYKRVGISPAVIGDFIPPKKDYGEEYLERSVWLEMAEYALYGAGAGIIAWSLVDVYRSWRWGKEFDKRMADCDRANTCAPTATPSRGPVGVSPEDSAGCPFESPSPEDEKKWDKD